MDKIEITWVDSRQVHGWTLLEDIDDTVCRVNTCGYLIKETQEAYTVALSVDKDFSQACGINVIPKCCVESKTIISQ